MSKKTPRSKQSSRRARKTARSKRPALPRPRQKAPQPGRKRVSRWRRRRGFGLTWGQVIAVGVVVVVGVALYFASRSPSGGPVTSKETPPFTLVSTSGSSISLSESRGKNLLLYFSEGVGCDPCFYQMVELEKNRDRLEEMGLTVLPIVRNPADRVVGELQRFGIQTPFLINQEGKVSEAYDVLGKGMHADLPGHSFVLVDGEGRIRWQKEYPSMYVLASDLVSALHTYMS